MRISNEYFNLVDVDSSFVVECDVNMSRISSRGSIERHSPMTTENYFNNNLIIIHI